MSQKYLHYAELSVDHGQHVASSATNWAEMLTTAARMYKYSFDEQLLIHAQKPNAVACAELPTWNRPVGRFVKKGTKGIALLDDTGDKQKLRYIFDIADTEEGRYNPKTPYIWQMKPEHEGLVQEALGGTFDEIPMYVAALVLEYVDENFVDIINALDRGSKDLDTFVETMTESATYMVMSRCGLDTSKFLDGAFKHITDIESFKELKVLGDGASTVSENVLRDIEMTIKRHDREQAQLAQNERSNSNGREHDPSTDQPDRNNLHPSGRLSDTRHRDSRGRGQPTAADEMGHDAEGISTETPPGTLHGHEDGRQAVSSLPRNRDTGEKQDGAVDENQLRNQQGIENPNGRNNQSGIDLLLNEEPTPPAMQQMDLFSFPTEQEQIISIVDDEQAEPAVQPQPNPMDFWDYHVRNISIGEVETYTEPFVEIEWSESPDFAEYERLSFVDADAKFKAVEATELAERAEQGIYGGYRKTSGVLFYKESPEDTELSTYEFRYDIGDYSGERSGLYNHINNLWANIQNSIDSEKFTGYTQQDVDSVRGILLPILQNALEKSMPTIEETGQQHTPAAENVADIIAEPPTSPPIVFFVDWKVAQHDFDMSLYKDRDKIGFNKDGVEYAVGKMGDVTYITTTTGITPWGDITGATNIPRNVWEQMNAYRNGDITADQVRENYLSVLDNHKQAPQAEVAPSLPEELQQDNAADYFLSYRFLSDPDRIIVFNDVDPDEVDIVARVHADGEVVIIKENVPQSVIDELTEYATNNLEGLKESAEARLQQMFDAAAAQDMAFDTQQPKTTEEPAVVVAKSPTVAIADYVQSKLETGEKFTSTELFAEATKAYGDTMANNAFTSKDAYDAMELGVNQYVLSSDNVSPEDMLKMLDLLPTQTRRTADMERFQQFSTPPSIAYLANWAANITADDIVLEPSAGIGGIAVFAKKDGATVYVNELDKRRLEIIKNLPFDGFFNEDAEQINNIHGDKLEPTVIIMNPPFSSSAERNIHNTKIGAKHIDEALKMLAPNGRLVAIVGQGMADDAPAFRSWWRETKEQYNVKANVGVDGKNYSKYGTSFGIQMLVIDKTGATTEPVKTAFVENLHDLQNILGGIRNDRPIIQLDNGSRNKRNTATTTRPMPVTEREPERKPNEPVSNASGRTDTAVVGDRREQTVKSEDAATVRGTSDNAPNLTSISNNGLAPNVHGGRDRGNDGRNDVDSGTGRTGVANNGQSAGSISPIVKPHKPVKTELTDSIFESYEPQRLLLENVQPHPANISESAAMSAIQPPPVTYKPNLNQDIIDKGILSNVQLEAVTYAGQSHSQTLPNGNTRGFFLGDGTGVGKGRTITGIILDNFQQGSKKALWLSENTGLVPDAKRDVKALFGTSDLVTEFKGGKKADASLSNSEAILFTTYSSLSKSFDQDGSNFNKIVNWLGKDFDGVIVFDEAHNMANSIATKGSRGVKKASQRGMAGLAIQEVLPNAKIVYSSATGATEVENLRYADRLGLWGEGTAFANGDVFVSKIKAGGLAAMELIARDMKATGVYLSRNISYEDVAYDKIVHQLTPEQRQIYDELARSWQIVLQNLNEALKTTNQSLDGMAKGKAYGAFWSAEQRFFNQILTAMQVPSMITDIQKQLDNDNSIVIQLVSTNESAQEREFARLQEQDLDLEDFDLTPKQMLMSYIENSFPIVQYEEYKDDNGNVKSKPVYDSEGKAVVNRDAVRQKEELLDKLGSIKVPSSALDMIINHFGSDMVAENTGRKRRVVIKDGKAKEENIANKKEADVTAFQNGDKRIIVFSKAGGTGKSYHADKSAKNQQHRVHYLLQAGWQADAAVQGFGRSHRSNQVSSPTFALVTTDLKGQMRFISTIAKRLDQLGALTKGQRQTGSQGLFTAGDNLENAFAADVLASFYKTLIQNRVDGVSDGVAVIEKLGLKDKLLDEYGHINVLAPEMREVNKFLNRILSLECHEQNAVFDGYAERLHIATEQAMQNGTLDKGLENYKADRVVLKETHDIRVDETTGATTKYFNLTAYDKVKPLQFADVNTKDVAFMGFYQSENTDAIRAVYKTSTITDEYGNVTDNCRLTGQDGNEYMPLSRLENNWVQLPTEKAEGVWNNAVAELPDFHAKNLHLIGGTVLPVWDKLPTENVRIYRVLTSDGDMLIGRVIPENMIDITLQKMGAERTKNSINTDDLLKGIKNGDTVHLDNGWRVTQKKVSNEQRIEVIGANYLHSDMLANKGLFTERIAFQTRYFIPAEKDTANILDEVIKISPVSRVESSKDRVSANAPRIDSNTPEKILAAKDGNDQLSGDETTPKVPTILEPQYPQPAAHVTHTAQAVLRPTVPTSQGQNKTDEPKQLTGFAAIMAKQEAKKAEPKANEIRPTPPPTRDKLQRKDTHEL